MKLFFLKKEKIVKDTFAFYFSTIGKDWKFTSGDFTTITLNNDWRDFTIASSTLDKSFTFVVTKKGKSLFKKALFNLKKDTLVDLEKPRGVFSLSKTLHPKVLLSGGIGITPFYSMIKSLSEKRLLFKLTLIASFSKKENIIFKKELEEIAKANSKIKVIFTLSRHDSNWIGEKGRISKEIIQKNVNDIFKSEYLIAGGGEMVDDTVRLLQEMEIEPENIKTDIFTGY